MSMQTFHRHSIMDAPFHESMSDANIIQHPGSLTGRFLFTERQPVFQFSDDSGPWLIQNVDITCATTAIQVSLPTARED